MSRIRFLLALLPLLVFAQNPTLTVDGKSNIYVAGRGVPFNGLVPPAVRFAAGAGKVVTFPSVSGQIACNGIAYEPLHGPEGTVNRCGGTGTNIASWAGISGVIHKTRQMFLVGVFLDEREPSDPAPAILDFSTADNFATLSPLIGQVFFIGDGRTSGGALQQFNVPANATRLYLGFADAVGFSGAPYAYNDNNGSLAVQVAGVTPFVPGAVATGTTMTVNGKSSIYWSGLDVNWPTEMPPGWKFTAAPGRVMTVRASGSVTCKTGISAPPEGTAACGAKTDLEPYGAVSGIQHPSRSMFLVGVFLNDLKPRGWPPSKLNFTDDNFATLAPLIGQTFYIGTGAGKRFLVPHDATRLFLGYARSDLMIGNPGWYNQGGGSLTAAIDITAGSDTGVSPIVVDAKSNLYAAGRAEAFDGYLPPMIRITPGAGKVMTVPRVTGQVRCCGGGFTTADGAPYSTNLNAYRGLSGIEVKWRGYFLAGVFLDDNVPDGAPPPKLTFQEPFNFASASPVIGQVFLIGDGVTQAGAPHQYAIPPTATRLYLGMALGRLFQGDPGYYWEGNDAYTATISISGGTVPPPCSYSLSETTRAVPAAASTATVTLTSAAGCNWTAVSNTSWITVTAGASGSGNGTVSYSVAANTGAARTGTLTIGGVTLTVTQAAAAPACTYTFEPTSIGVWHLTFSGTVGVTTAAGCSWTAASLAPWIRVTSGESGNGPGRVGYEVAANPNAATRDGYLRIGTADFLIKQAPLQAMPGQPPSIAAGGVVNGADFTAGLSPGMIFSIFGTNFAAGVTVAQSTPLPELLDGVAVEVVEGTKVTRAPLFFVSPNQINAQLPFEIAGTEVDIRVRTASGVSAEITVTVVPRLPRILTMVPGGAGDAAALHADWRLVSRETPATPGEVLILFLTGLGAVDPPVAPGAIANDGSPGKPLHWVKDPVEVTIGGVKATVLFAGLAPGFIGLYQINFQMPAQPVLGAPAVQVASGQQSSQATANVPTGVAWETIATAAIPAGGGTISAGPLTIELGAGTVTGTKPVELRKAKSFALFGQYTLGDVYSLPAVSPGFGPIRISTDLPTGVDPGSIWLAWQTGGESGYPDLLPVTVSGNRITAEIPAAAVAARAAEPTGPSWMPTINTVIAFVKKYREKDVADALFTILHAEDRPIDAVESALRECWRVAERMSLLRPNLLDGRRIQVIVLPEKNLVGNSPFVPDRESLDPWGMVLSLGGADPPRIYLQPSLTSGPQNLLQPRIFHLFMHALQDLWSPVHNARLGWPWNNDLVSTIEIDESWVWLDEALAGAFEYSSEQSYVPSQAVENADFLVKHELEYPTTIFSRLTDPFASVLSGCEPMRRHGYGATLFLTHLLNAQQEPLSTLRRLLELRAAGPTTFHLTIKRVSHEYYPVEALHIATGNKVGEQWVRFVNDLVGGKVLPAAESTEKVLAMVRAEDRVSFDPSQSAKMTLNWESKDLSARFYRLAFPKPWPNDPRLQVKLTNDKGITAGILLYPLYANGGIGERLAIVESGQTVTIANAGDAMAGAQTSLLAVVVNYRVVKPYHDVSNLTIELTATGNAPPAAVFNYVTAGSAYPLKCDIYNFGVTSRNVSFPIKDIWNPNRNILSWSGDTFRWSGTRVDLASNKPSQTWTFSVTGQLANNVARAQVRGNMVQNQNNDEKDEFDLEFLNLPCPAGTPFITRCSVTSATFRGAPATYFKVNNYKIFNKSGKEIGSCQLDLNVSGIPSDSRAVSLTFMN